MLKKLSAVLLSCSMLFAGMPGTVYAEADPSSTEETAQTSSDPQTDKPSSDQQSADDQNTEKSSDGNTVTEDDSAASTDDSENPDLNTQTVSDDSQTAGNIPDNENTESQDQHDDSENESANGSAEDSAEESAGDDELDDSKSSDSLENGSETDDEADDSTASEEDSTDASENSYGNSSDVSEYESEKPDAGNKSESFESGTDYWQQSGVQLPFTEVVIETFDNPEYRWNSNSLGTAYHDVVHLDDLDGMNCYYSLVNYSGGYYGIKFSDASYYVDSEGDNDHTNEVLHNGKKDFSQDNQKFKFIPVEGEKDVYYILSKKGDNSKKNLFIGLENNSGISKHVKVATTSSPFKWRVRSVLKDQPENMKKFPGSFIMITAPDSTFNVGVNTHGAVITYGQNIIVDNVSQTPKTQLLWSDKFGAYKLRQKFDEEVAQQEDYWDIDGRSGYEGKNIHTWYEISTSYSQYWYFIEVPNKPDTYYIQNAFTGMYASASSYNEDTKLLTSKTPCEWIISQIDQNDQRTWMKSLDDERMLTGINLPGTHDSGTADVFLSGNELSISKCQSLFIDEQLNIGVRAFDIRCGKTESPGYTDIVHGESFVKCKNKNKDTLTLREVFDQAKDFLQHNPSETVIMVVRDDANGGADMTNEIAGYIRNKTYPFYQWDSDMSTPTLGECRGKIVLMRRYDCGSSLSNDEKNMLGPDLSDWDDHDYTAQKEAIKIFDGGSKVFVQDSYESNVEDKKNYITGTLDQINKKTSESNVPLGSFIFNYTSATSPLDIWNYTMHMNPWLYPTLNYNRNSTRMGITMLNYAEMPLVDLIINSNTETSYTPDVEGTIVFGEPYETAVFEGSGQTWPVDASMKNEDPSMKDFQINVIGTPGSGPYGAKKGTATLSVTKKTIQVSAPEEQMIYAKELPAVKWNFELLDQPDNQLVDKASLENLKLMPVLKNKSTDQEYDLSVRPIPTDLPGGYYSLIGVKAANTNDPYYPCYEFTAEEKTVLAIRTPMIATGSWSGDRLYKKGDPLNLELNLKTENENVKASVASYKDNGTENSSYNPQTGKWTVYHREPEKLNNEDVQLHENVPLKAAYLVRDDSDPLLFKTEISVKEGTALKDLKLEAAEFENGYLTLNYEKNETKLTRADSGKSHIVYLYSEESKELVPFGTVRITVLDTETVIKPAASSGTTGTTGTAGTSTAVDSHVSSYLLTGLLAAVVFGLAVMLKAGCKNG